MRKAQLDESKGMMSCTEQIIRTGLRYLVARDFQCIDYYDRVVGNTISVKIGLIILYAFDSIKMLFQGRATNNDVDATQGTIPQIDLLFHGRLNSLGIDLAVDLDGDGLKLHLQRFREKYARLKEDGVILHIDTERSEPELIESFDEDEDHNDKIYTFLVHRNELYRGSYLIRSKVCDALAAPLEYQTLNKKKQDESE